MTLFIMHDHMKKCRGCNRVEHWTALYQPTAEGAATRLQPVPRSYVLSEMDVVRRTLIADADVPVCRECIDRSPEYEKRASAAAERWAETVRRTRGEALLPSEERRRRETEKQARKQTRIEELA